VQRAYKKQPEWGCGQTWLGHGNSLMTKHFRTCGLDGLFSEKADETTPRVMYEA
jgi:hypothetical protein